MMREWIDTVANLTENEEDDAYWVYHVTQADYVPEIVKHGLQPQAPDADGWPEYDEDEWDDDEEDESPAEDKPPEAFEPRLFAWDDFGVAKTYAHGISGEPVILRINGSDIDWDVGRTDFRYLYTTQPIAPSLIEILGEDGSWHPLIKP